MPIKTEPFLDGKFGWNYGENNWNDGIDENILKMSFMINGNIDGVVASLPASPTDGTAYFLTTDNTLNARVDGAWRSFPTPLGFIVRDKVSGVRYEFNGSSLASYLSLSDKTKLDTVASGATVNSTDAQLRDRATHTGAQAISTVTGLQAALNLKADLASPTFTGTPSAPTPSTADDSTKLATTAFVKAQGYMLEEDQMVTSVAGRDGDVVLVKADVGLGSVDNTADAAKPVSTAQQTALDLKANLAGATFTGTIILPSTTSIGTVTNTEISYLVGTSSNLQAQIDSITGVSGAYAPINNPTFTGTVGGITKAMVGLGNVDNTSDVSKPVSTAQQTALNLKANVANPLFTGKITGDFTNATEASRVLFQTTTANSATHVGVIPNGTSETAELKVYNTTDTANASTLSLSASGVDDLQIKADRTGTGDYLSMVFYTGGLPRVTFWSNGAVTLPASTDIGNVTATEISFLDGVSSNLQTQLNAKQATLAYTPVNKAGDTITGTLAANLFSGSGASLTTLNASNISSGTIAAARLPYTFAIPATPSTAVLRDSGGGVVVDKSMVLYTGVASPTYTDAGLRIQSSAGTPPAISFYTTSAGDAGVIKFNSSGVFEIRSTGGTTGGAIQLATMTVETTANLPTSTSIGSVSATEISYLDGVTSSIQTQLNTKSPIVNPVFTGNDIVLDAASGQASLYLRQAGVNNGRIWAGGGAGTDINIESGRFISMVPTSDFNINYAGSTKFSVPASGVVTAADASGLANLNASNISSGTLAAARLPFTVNTASSVSTVVQRDGAGDMYANNITASGYLNGANIFLQSAAPVIIVRDTDNPVSTMITYTSYRDSTNTEQAWFGFGSGNGEFTFYNASRNIKFSSPVVCNSTLNVSGVITGDGSGLTTLNASNISSGTLASARMTAGTTSVVGAVQLDNSIVSSDTTRAATPYAVNQVYQYATGMSGSLPTTYIAKATPSQTTQSISHSSAGTLTINLANGTDVQVNVSANITGLAFTNAPSSSEAWSVTLEFITSGTRTITWPSGTKAAGGTLPTLTTSGTDVFVLRKRATDNYMVFTSGKAMA